MSEARGQKPRTQRAGIRVDVLQNHDNPLLRIALSSVHRTKNGIGLRTVSAGTKPRWRQVCRHFGATPEPSVTDS